MDLELTDEQRELRDSARAALARECPASFVRAVARGRAEATELHSALAWLGWPALTVDVDLGGLGRGFVDLAVVVEELGRAAAPGSFLPTTTQFAPVVREVGTPAQAHRFLAGVAAGELTGSLALHEGGRWGPETITATAERDGDGWLLRGHKQHVLGAPEVDEVVVAAQRDDGTLGLFVVPAAELSFKRTTSLDPTRTAANLELNGVWVPDARLLGEPGTDARRPLDRALAEATVGLALDALGACGALFDSSLGIVRDGPVAAQATEHALADMLVEIELGRAATYQAVAAVAEAAPEAGRLASVAKAQVGATVRRITGLSVEIRGAGAGPEHDDHHLWIGRAKADDLLFGSAADHRRIVADHLLSHRRARTHLLASALLG
ncbi:MAG TPA: acyl-CoA dehydrogenase family protein [Acidimicrobiales bacterium]